MTDCPNPSNGSTNWALSTEAAPAVITAGTGTPPPGAFRFTVNNGVTDLIIGYQNEIRTKREWSLGNLVSSTGVTEELQFHAPNPTSGSWTEGNSNCLERHVYQGAWSTIVDSNNVNSGFKGPVDDQDSQYVAGTDTFLSYLIVREREEAADFRGTTIYRHITHAFPLKIKLKNTVTVDDDVNVFAPVNVLAALTESTILPKAGDPTKVEVKLVIQTQTQAPFYLRQQDATANQFGPNAGSNTPNDLSIIPSGTPPKFTPPAAADITITHQRAPACDLDAAGNVAQDLADFQAGLTLCDQTFTIEFELLIVDPTLGAVNCEADGVYQLKTRARCRTDLSPTYFDALNTLQADPAIGCPIIDPVGGETNQWDGNIDITLDTADYCNKYEINVELDGTLGVFEDQARTIDRDDFFLDTRIYFRAHLYSTDSAIQLNSVTLNSVEVTGPVGGGSQILWPSPGDANQRSACGIDWDIQIQGNSINSVDAGQYTDPTTQTQYNTIKFDFDYIPNPELDVTYSTNGIPQTLSGIGNCGMQIASDENKVLGTTVEFAVQYVGTPSSRTTHLTIGEGEEAALLSVSRQAADGGDSATNEQATEFVVAVPRGEDNTQTPGAINTGSSKDAASTLSSFLF